MVALPATAITNDAETGRSCGDDQTLIQKMQAKERQHGADPGQACGTAWPGQYHMCCFRGRDAILWELLNLYT